MNRLQRTLRFLAPQRIRLCGWATVRVIRLHRRLRTENLPTLLEPIETRKHSGSPRHRAVALRQAEDLWRFLNVLLIQGLRRKDVCLVRSLILFEFLQNAGIPATIHFGVQAGAPDLTGHCWISLDGRPFLEGTDPDSTFQEMFAYPPQPDES